MPLLLLWMDANWYVLALSLYSQLCNSLYLCVSHEENKRLETVTGLIRPILPTSLFLPDVLWSWIPSTRESHPREVFMQVHLLLSSRVCNVHQDRSCPYLSLIPSLLSLLLPCHPSITRSHSSHHSTILHRHQIKFTSPNHLLAVFQVLTHNTSKSKEVCSQMKKSSCHRTFIDEDEGR